MNNIDSALHELFLKYQPLEFSWGLVDCTHFAADWVYMFTGKSYFDDFPEYNSEREAFKVLLELGYGDQDELLDNYFTRVPKRKLMRGDLVGHYFLESKVMTIGVNVGTYAIFKNDKKGLVNVSLNEIDSHLCWRVE